MSPLLLYALLLFTLLAAKKTGYEWLPTAVLVLPLFLYDERELGLKRHKRGLITGAPFLFAGLLLYRGCPGFALKQAGVAFAEELFFRGYLMRYYSNAAVSALFALAHFVYWGSLNALLTFFPSLLFGFLYRKSGSLWAAVLAHWGANLAYYGLLTRFPGLFGLLNRPLIELPF
ncbi:MAG: CPBP family intramembrane metalloprotease [Aquificae bacterium]|nr:CPBP family intramembrane metalloprotease [Aquificota bacterium]